MNTQEIEQIILAITQTMLLINQLFMTKKMREGMIKIGSNKELLQDIDGCLTRLNENLAVLEDRLNDLVQTLNVDKND